MERRYLAGAAAAIRCFVVFGAGMDRRPSATQLAIGERPMRRDRALGVLRKNSESFGGLGENDIACPENMGHAAFDCAAGRDKGQPVCGACAKRALMPARTSKERLMGSDRAWIAALAVAMLAGAAAVSTSAPANAQSVLDVVENPTLAAARAMSDAAADIVESRTERNAAMLQAQLEAATAAAARPGDESLTCEQLQAEAYALAEDPSLTAASETIDESMRDQANRAKISAGVNTATLVGGAIATSGNAQARDVFILGQSASVLAQAASTIGADAKPMAAASAMMPAMGRLQRVHALAEEKDCAFMRREATAAQDQYDE
jgi:hypothetical protein